MIPFRIPLRVWIMGGVLLVVLMLYAAFKYQQKRADDLEAKLIPAEASRDALDKVAIQTPLIREEQKEKEQAVEQIPGSDQRLPDGYGNRLEQLRKRGPNTDSR